MSSRAAVYMTTGKWRVMDLKEEHYFICQNEYFSTPEVKNQATLTKLKFRSEADMNDPVVQHQILEQVQ